MPLNRLYDFKRFEDAYKMDIWEGARKDGEERVVLPTGFAHVEDARAMIFARPPQWSIPVTGEGSVATKELAEKIEAYVYAASEEMQLVQCAYDAEWYAQCYGEVGLKIWYDDNAPFGEFPVRTRVVNPAEVSYQFMPYGDEFSELTHTSMRTRRSIEDEYGIKIQTSSRPDDSVDDQRYEDWLDEVVVFHEYWTVTYEMGPPPKTPEEKAMETADAIGGKKSKKPGRKPKTSKDELVRIKKVIAGCYIEGDDEESWVKTPAVMEGYETIPYFWWGGIRTGIKDRRWVSGLYSLTGGDGHTNADGVIQTQNLILSLYIAASYRATYSAKITDSKQLATNGIDYGVDNVNPVESGTVTRTLEEPPPQQHMLNVVTQLDKFMGRVGTPEALSGALVNNSGASIAGQTTVHMLKLAGMQQERARVLRRGWQHVLNLTRTYAGSLGWTPRGDSRTGKPEFTTLRSSDVPENVYVGVKLSDKYPRDEISMLTLLANLVSQKLLSFETFAGFFQQIYGLGADTPQRERDRIMRDQTERSPELARAIGEVLAQKFTSRAMPQPPAPPSNEQPANPEQVIPPEMMTAPGRVPSQTEVAATGNLEGYNNMIGGNIAQREEIGV